MLITYREPQSLQELCMAFLRKQLFYGCYRLEKKAQDYSYSSNSRQMLTYIKERVRPYYINSLSFRIRSRLIEDSNKMHFYANHVMKKLGGLSQIFYIAILFGKGIRRLKFNICCYYGCSHQTCLLEFLATEGDGLEDLELERTSLLRLDFRLLHSALFSMKNLKQLTLKHIASDPVLEIVGKTCPKLVLLDVEGSALVTDAGLKQLLFQVEFKHRVSNPNTEEHSTWSRLKSILSKFMIDSQASENRKEHSVLLEHCEHRNFLCDTLRVLNVTHTSVTTTGMLAALMHVPNLESLAGYLFTKKFFEIMNQRDVNVNNPFSLTQATCIGVTPSGLATLAQACPKITTLYIRIPQHPPKALEIFHHIISLTAENAPMDRDWVQFCEYLRSNGRNLQELTLRYARDRDRGHVRMDLREVFTYCPNLRKLVMDGTSVYWSTGPDPPVLKCLRAIQIGNDVTAMTITKILSLAPELTALHIYACNDLTVEYIEKLSKETSKNSWKFGSAKRCDTNTFVQSLKCFYINSPPIDLPLSTVLHMLKTWSKLQKIGNMGAVAEEMLTIKHVMVHANIGVELLRQGHWFASDCMH